MKRSLDRQKHPANPSVPALQEFEVNVNDDGMHYIEPPPPPSLDICVRNVGQSDRVEIYICPCTDVWVRLPSFEVFIGDREYLLLERRRRFRKVDGDENERFSCMCGRLVLRRVRERERDVPNKPGRQKTRHIAPSRRRWNAT